MGKKRDRWDSSSEDETDDNNTKSKGKDNKSSKRKPTSNDPATPYSKKKDVLSSINQDTPPRLSVPLHNPLLQGCRAVYDTYDRIARLSEGTYGIVWKAKDLVTKEIVALKQIKFDPQIQQQQGFPVTALREINVLLALSHENIVSVREMVVGSDVDKVFMVMEFFSLDLQEAVERRKYPNVLRQAELKGVLQQILRGMEYMHSQWYMHRDMKTSNILVHETGRVALCDFGLARRYQDPPINYTQLVVTLWYRAPELLFGEEKYTPAIDIWSIGCIFGELIQQEAMMQGQGELDQIDKIFSMLGAPDESSWPEFSSLPSAKIFRWRSASSSAASTQGLRQLFPINPPPHFKHTFLDGNGFDLLTKLLTLNPKKRITAKEALKHPYFHEGVAPALPNFFDDTML
ncbi:serine/threonine protein kinase [Nitzschia inconspicua]|uniref:Cyclin-dependent kinase 2 homolog n=1 Tax=Nitzschia inconspicua TaxID=303405 RepID=A0A9K3KGV8_9STRA|nr:serine/threonine protein kinase [Nitzschia inconspicua]